MQAELIISRNGTRGTKTLESRIKGAPKVPKVIPNIVLASPESHPKRSSIATTHMKKVSGTNEPYMASSIGEKTVSMFIDNASRNSKEQTSTHTKSTF